MHIRFQVTPPTIEPFSQRNSAATCCWRPTLNGGRAMTKAEARRIVKRFMAGYQPPITCAHRFTRWYGLLIQWRSCEDCRLVEGRIG